MYSQFFEMGPELAVGYILTKFTGKFRTPVNISLAAVISNVFPILGRRFDIIYHEYTLCSGSYNHVIICKILKQFF